MPARAKLEPMNVALQKPWTPERFLAWAETQEEPYEFDGNQPVAMTGGSQNHDRITGNIYTALRSRLRGTPCSNHGPNLGVRTINSKIRYPDALITCTKFPGSEKIAPNVVVVFEVVSSSSSSTDRIEKVREYAMVNSIRRYIIIETNFGGLLVLHRKVAEDDWTALTLTGDDILEIPEVSISIPVNELYENVDFAEASAGG